MYDPSRQFVGLQFHPEVRHTPHGTEMLEHFIALAGARRDWNPAAIRHDLVGALKRKIAEGTVICGVSGGVDSSVVAALLHKAIGEQLTCVFVDTGLLRHREGDQVMATFAEHMGVKVIRVDAEGRFLKALGDEADPERKRKIIGNLFIEVFEEEAAKIEGVQWLAQGTIYPDVIESAGAKSGKAHVIKSHHNVGGLPDIMHLKVVEPLRLLFGSASGIEGGTWSRVAASTQRTEMSCRPFHRPRRR